MKVTRVAYSHRLNAGKYAALSEQARRLGRVRSEVWQRYGSVKGASLRDRQVRDRWTADGTSTQFGVLVHPWHETVRDAMADIAANRAAAKVSVRRAVHHHTTDSAERKRLYVALKSDRWPSDPYLSRQMRKHWRRGHNHTHNQIVVMPCDARIFTLTENGNVWLTVIGLARGERIRIPLNTTVGPTGTLRLILRNGRVEVHYQIDAADVKTSQYPCGTQEIGIDKGYTEVLVDSDGVHHGPELGPLLTAESDHRKAKGRARARLRSIANQAVHRGDHAKADRIARNNLGDVKRAHRQARWEARVRAATFTAVHRVVDKAATVVAEDLTKTYAGRRYLGKKMNRRLAAWTKGVTAEALKNVSERRGSTLRLVNAAYTSQTCPDCNGFGRRGGDWLYCTPCGVVWDVDHAAAINVRKRLGDPDITLFTPHKRVKQILQERIDRQRTRLPVQDSSPLKGGERKTSRV